VRFLTIDELMVSGVNISEDGYDYRGTFILSCKRDSKTQQSLSIDLAEFESEDELIDKIKCYFNIQDNLAVIKQKVLTQVILYSGLSSKDEQGENFNQDSDSSTASSTFDKA
jgi:hypothetical protein